VKIRPFPLTLLLAAALLATSACSGLAALGIKDKGGLDRVDKLLSAVERVQVECAVSKERSQEAFDHLRGMVAPEFRGDPAVAHAELETAVEASEDQAESLERSVKPMRRTAETVFERWTSDLESFGNLAMRQRSQERLEETRRRYDAIVSAAIAAQLAYDGFNGDLKDNALFLEHDFNASSVGLVAQGMDAMRSRGRELAKRLDACIEACQAYVEFSAPQNQVTDEPAETESSTEEPEAEKTEAAPTTKKPAPKRKTAPRTQGG
jgi:hypothetical protein